VEVVGGVLESVVGGLGFVLVGGVLGFATGGAAAATGWAGAGRYCAGGYCGAGAGGYCGAGAGGYCGAGAGCGGAAAGPGGAATAGCWGGAAAGTVAVVEGGLLLLLPVIASRAPYPATVDAIPMPPSIKIFFNSFPQGAALLPTCALVCCPRWLRLCSRTRIEYGQEGPNSYSNIRTAVRDWR
jgi:hypothetical protein